MARETTPEPRNGRTGTTTTDPAARQDPDRRRPPARHGRPPVAAAEAALVLHYARLARLAYTVLPGTLDRHRRVLAAHALVQQALPNRLPELLAGHHPAVPVPRRSPDAAADPALAPAPADPAYVHLRAAVLTAALRSGARRRAVLLPRTWGLTLFPSSDGPESLALERALTELDATERAAYALLALEGLSQQAAAQLLVLAGVEDPGPALGRAARLGGRHPADALAAADFDPCTVHARPTDLLRRRRRIRVGVAAVAGAAVAVLVALALPGSAPTPVSAAPAGAAATSGGGAAATGAAVSVADLVRVPADSWRHTARIDFTAWPARGDLLGDRSLLTRALALWGTAGERSAAPLVRATPGTVAAPPAQEPRLLWSGHLDGADVVLLDDGTDLARYTRPDHPTAADPERLELTRSDESDVTTAGAVLLRGSKAGDRFLIAPWVDTVQLRDLRAPDTPAQDLVPADGVTAAVPAPPSSGCGSWPVLQLRSSSVIAEHHAFLLTDLGGVTAAHLTYTPPPTAGPANYPREATGADALLAWARLGCGLTALRGQDVKAVNAWEFAQQPLPEGQGTALWTCTRADRWDGSGSAATEFLAPTGAGDLAAPALTTASQPQGRACSRYEQYVVAGTWWQAPGSGHGYLLAAGSRNVTRLGAQGGVTVPSTAAPTRTLAVPAARPRSAVVVTGALDTGQTARTLN